jgi:hypothetical protein
VTEYLPRSAWTDVPKPAGLTPLDPGEVVGDAQHWPGEADGDVYFARMTRAQIADYLEGIRRYHVNMHGWTDIAYLTAIDPAGRVWDLRGIEHRSAANGDTIPNQRYGATLWLVGPNEEPTDAQITASQTHRQDRWLARYPHAVQVKRHADVRPEGTECPGPHVGALVANGTLTQPPEEDMPLDAADLAAVKRIVTDAVDPIQTSVSAVPKNTWATQVPAVENSAGKALTALTVIGNTANAVGTVTLTDAQLRDLARLLAPVVAAPPSPTAAEVAAEVIAQLRAHPLTPKP